MDWLEVDDERFPMPPWRGAWLILFWLPALGCLLGMVVSLFVPFEGVEWLREYVKAFAFAVVVLAIYRSWLIRLWHEREAAEPGSESPTGENRTTAP